MKQQLYTFFMKITRTEEYEIDHRYGLREGVQNAKIFLNNAEKYIKPIKNHYTHYHTFDIFIQFCL